MFSTSDEAFWQLVGGGNCDVIIEPHTQWEEVGVMDGSTTTSDFNPNLCLFPAMISSCVCVQGKKTTLKYNIICFR